jgi:hypothetical protein
MEIQVKSVSEIVVQGTVKSVSDYQEIKKVVSGLLRGDGKELSIYMPDSYSITSSVIGFFLKLVYQDRVDLKLFIADERLYGLLNDLNLSEPFKVEKMQPPHTL